MGQDGRESMRGGRREKGSETSISRRRRAAVKAPSRGKCRTQSQQQQLEGGGVGSGIPMPQLLHTGRRRGHLNEVLTDIQARSEAELPKKKKNTQPQRRQSEKVGNAKQRFSTSSGKWKRGL